MEALQDQCYLSKAYPIMKRMWIAFLLDAVFACVCAYVVCTCVTKMCAFLLREITDETLKETADLIAHKLSVHC